MQLEHFFNTQGHLYKKVINTHAFYRILFSQPIISTAFHVLTTQSKKSYFTCMSVVDLWFKLGNFKSYSFSLSLSTCEFYTKHKYENQSPYEVHVRIQNIFQGGGGSDGYLNFSRGEGRHIFVNFFLM